MASAKVIEVQQLGNFVPFSGPNLFAKLFSHCFPFRYGHAEIEQNVTVGLQQSAKQYFSISSWRFIQNDTISVLAFDIVSRKWAMGQNTLMCKINLSQMANFEIVTATELGEQLDQVSIREWAIQERTIIRGETRRREAKLILRKVEAALGSAFATNEERKAYQRRAWKAELNFTVLQC